MAYIGYNASQPDAPKASKKDSQEAAVKMGVEMITNELTTQGIDPSAFQQLELVSCELLFHNWQLLFYNLQMFLYNWISFITSYTRLSCLSVGAVIST